MQSYVYIIPLKVSGRYYHYVSHTHTHWSSNAFNTTDTTRSSMKSHDKNKSVGFNTPPTIDPPNESGLGSFSRAFGRPTHGTDRSVGRSTRARDRPGDGRNRPIATGEFDRWVVRSDPSVRPICPSSTRSSTRSTRIVTRTTRG